MESLTNLMTILGEYKVQIFFNFERNNETTFNSLAVEGPDKYMEKTAILENQSYSEYVIPVIPNFTIIPKDKSGVLLDYKMKYEEENGVKTVFMKKKESYEIHRIEGIYIDASYVAAGITAAYQCPNYLRERFNSVSQMYPGVRFDIESEDNSYKARTTMARKYQVLQILLKTK